MKKNITLLTLCALLSWNFLSAQVNLAAEVAAGHIRQNLKALQLTESDIAGMAVSDEVFSRHNQVTHVYFQQQYAGIPVHDAILNVNVLKDGRVLRSGNRFVRHLAGRVNATSPQLSMRQAVASALSYFGIESETPPRMTERISDAEAVFDPAGIALEPIPVTLIYQPMPDRSVRLSWNVMLYERNGRHWWNARIDALTGKVLDYFDQVVHCEFETPAALCENAAASVWAPEPRETKEMTVPFLDGPRYNVFPLTVESPNHGSRSLEFDPADLLASPFGWHDVDGVQGPEFTVTRGNNVHAYHDIFSQNASLGDEPDGGDSLHFDFDLDLSTDLPYTQLDPIVTNLFYWNNLMHDVWYHYGFDEAAGNFQVNNYGNGGIGEDPVRAEALDGSGTNNANFGTPPDGNRPRMQMFLWGGQLPDFPDPELLVTDGEGQSLSLGFAQAGFGAELPPNDLPLTGELILADDGVAPGSDACQALINGADLTGKVALIDRGECQFGFKVLAAENEGAIAVVICNNVPDPIIAMAPGEVGDQVTIPAVMISLADCNALKMNLEGTTISLSAPEFAVPDPGPTGRSSDFDNGIIAHEYTHGISNRLTAGPANSGCLTNFEQAGEGWSDWFGLVMTTTPDMTAEQPRGVGTYAINQPTSGDGIRSYPYSRDMNVNPHTYADINSESVPHGVGSVWCVTIWDLYWNLVDEYGYDTDLYTGSGGNNIAMQLVIDGLKLQPCDPNFLESRDAILLADSLSYDGANQCLIWETFARRGLGASAEPDGVEAFDVPDACNFTFRVEKTTVAEANAGDVITYNLEIVNGRAEGIENAVIVDDLPPGVTFVEGSSNCDITEEDGLLTISLGSIESGFTGTCSYDVQLAETPFTYVTFEDDVENGAQNWNFQNPIGSASWSETTADANSGTTSFFAPNINFQSDQYLVVSEPRLLDGPNPALSFWHRYDTETGWDGGVVEISINGTLWLDLGSAMIQNGYDGQLNANPDSPISSRQAFHGNSNGWKQTIVDLSNFAGATVRIRFRLGCDGAVGAEGWYVDDIRFFGDIYAITNVACTDNEGEALCSRATTLVMGELTSSSEEINQDLGLSIFPNPTRDQFTIRMNGPALEKTELRVMGADGRLLLSRPFDTFRSETVDMSAFGPGIYLVQLRTERGVTTRKLVVQ